MRIRAATPDDAEAIVNVHIRSWQVAYRGQVSDSYLDALPQAREARITWRREHAGGVWVAEEAEGIIGFVSIGPTRDEGALPGTGEVGAIYLAPEAWGTGVGRELFAKAVEELRAAGFTRAMLWVLDTNERAQRFYRAAGWAPDGAAKTEERPGATLREVRFAVEL